MWADFSAFFFFSPSTPTGCAFIKGRVQLPDSRGKFSLFFPAGGVQSLSKLGLSKRHAKKTSPLVTSRFRSVYILLMEASEGTTYCVGILISGSRGHIDMFRALQCGKIDFHVVFDFLFFRDGIPISLCFLDQKQVASVSSYFLQPSCNLVCVKPGFGFTYFSPLPASSCYLHLLQISHL